MSLSIRWRLTISIAIALVVTLTAIFVTLHLVLGGVLSADLDDDLARDAGRISAQVALVGSLDESDRLQQIVELYSAGGSASPSMAVIQDPQGAVIAASGGASAQSLALTEAERQRVLAGETVSRTVEAAEGGELRIRASRLTIGRQVAGIVQVAEDANVASRPLSRLQTILLAEGIVGGLLALAIGYWLARGALKPIGDVVQVATEIEASDLSRRLNARGKPQELQRLADTFDGMLERLSAAFQQQQNFVLDVSHELRTPLTALRGNLDVLLMDQQLGPETRAQLERMSLEVGRLIRLTSNLLYLAHADAGRELDRRPVELDLLCLEVYRQTKDLKPEVRFRLGHEDQVTLVGDHDLLKQLILNLVDNGMKYTPAGGQVVLSLYRDESQARIVVEDSGPGIPAEDVPLIFQRFYRRESGAGGAGIGLAISRWIAEAHGGRIEVESEVGRGSRFIVLLPLGADG